MHVVYLQSTGCLYCGVFTHFKIWVEFSTFSTRLFPSGLPFLLANPQQMDLVLSGLCLRCLLICLKPLDLIYPMETLNSAKN